MVLILHILIALASIVFTTYLFFSPSKAKLYTSYGLVILTFTSGTYLVLIKPSHLVESCIMGLIYLGVVSVGLVSAHRKLATSKITI